MSHLRAGFPSITKEWAFPGGSVGKEFACNAGDAGDTGSIPGSGRSLGLGNGNPLQYSCLENPMAREARQATVHWVTKSQTRLQWLSTHARLTIECYSESEYQALPSVRKQRKHSCRLIGACSRQPIITCTGTVRAKGNGQATHCPVHYCSIQRYRRNIFILHWSVTQKCRDPSFPLVRTCSMLVWFF